jgi:hypothetical protein
MIQTAKVIPARMLQVANGDWLVNSPKIMVNAGISLPVNSQWQLSLDSQWIGKRKTCMQIVSWIRNGRVIST